MGEGESQEYVYVLILIVRIGRMRTAPRDQQIQYRMSMGFIERRPDDRRIHVAFTPAPFEPVDGGSHLSRLLTAERQLLIAFHPYKNKYCMNCFVKCAVRVSGMSVSQCMGIMVALSRVGVSKGFASALLLMKQKEANEPFRRTAFIG